MILTHRLISSEAKIEAFFFFFCLQACKEIPKPFKELLQTCCKVSTLRLST